MNELLETKVAKDPMVVDASPTKGFFVSMLIKDIELIDAIADLVDNSVDGARRLKGEDFDGLNIRIEATREHFKIADNCGGISVDVARNYAFKFGRSETAPTTSHSIGQFGVGMKRALFKLGRTFQVESRTKNSYFSLKDNVDDWQRRIEWTFRFTEMIEDMTCSPSSSHSEVEI